MALDFSVNSDIILKEPQRQAIEFCYSQANAVISLQTGLGKTLCACVLTRELMKAYPSLLAIYLVPQKAVKAFDKELKRLGLPHALWTSEKKLSQKGARILILTHTSLAKYKEDIVKIAATRKCMMVVDEIHNFSNPKSKLFKELSSVRKFFPLFYGSTATTIRNDLNSLYWIVTMVRPGYFGTLWQFQARYLNMKQSSIRIRGGAKRTIHEAVGVKDPDALKAALDKVIIFRQQEYNVEYHYIDILMEHELWERYREAGMGKLRETAADNWAVRLVDMQYVVDNVSPNFDALELTEKERKFLGLIKKMFETGNIPIVYCFYLETMTRLKTLLESLRFRLGLSQVYIINGKVPQKERALIEDRIKPNTVTIFNKAGTESVNLQRANCIIYYDLPWSIDEFLQSLGRITRTDTKFDKQHVFMLETEGTIDNYRSLRIRNHVATVEAVQGKQNVADGGDLITAREMKQLQRVLLWCFKQDRPLTKDEVLKVAKGELTVEDFQ